MQLLDNVAIALEGHGGMTDYEFWLYVDPEADGQVVAHAQRHGSTVVTDWGSEACLQPTPCESAELSPMGSAPREHRYDITASDGDIVTLDVETETGRDGFVTETLSGTYSDPDGGNGGNGDDDNGNGDTPRQSGIGSLVLLAVVVYILYRMFGN